MALDVCVFFIMIMIMNHHHKKSPKSIRYDLSTQQKQTIKLISKNEKMNWGRAERVLYLHTLVLTMKRRFNCIWIIVFRF